MDNPYYRIDCWPPAKRPVEGAWDDFEKREEEAVDLLKSPVAWGVVPNSPASWELTEVEDPDILNRPPDWVVADVPNNPDDWVVGEELNRPPEDWVAGLLNRPPDDWPEVEVVVAGLLNRPFDDWVDVEELNKPPDDWFVEVVGLLKSPPDDWVDVEELKRPPDDWGAEVVAAGLLNRPPDVWVVDEVVVDLLNKPFDDWVADWPVEELNRPVDLLTDGPLEDFMEESWVDEETADLTEESAEDRTLEFKRLGAGFCSFVFISDSFASFFFSSSSNRRNQCIYRNQG